MECLGKRDRMSESYWRKQAAPIIAEVLKEIEETYGQHKD